LKDLAPPLSLPALSQLHRLQYILESLLSDLSDLPLKLYELGTGSCCSDLFFHLAPPFRPLPPAAASLSEKTFFCGWNKNSAAAREEGRKHRQKENTQETSQGKRPRRNFLRTPRHRRPWRQAEDSVCVCVHERMRMWCMGALYIWLSVCVWTRRRMIFFIEDGDSIFFFLLGWILLSMLLDGVDFCERICMSWLILLLYACLAVQFFFWK
jgi:hypothetical protein